MEKRIKLTLPLLPECIVAARLVVSAVCTLLRFDVDKSDDMKLCVSEACTILMNEKFESVQIELEFSEGLRVCVISEYHEGIVVADGEMSRMLIEGLTERAEFSEHSGVVTGITFYEG